MAFNPSNTVKVQGPGNLKQLMNIQKLAAAGSSQTDATPITTKSGAVVWATAANGAKGILLPKAVVGKYYTIVNDDAANGILKVYPNEAAGVINALSPGAAISMAAKTRATFICIEDQIRNGGTPTWATVPLVPS